MDVLLEMDSGETMELVSEEESNVAFDFSSGNETTLYVQQGQYIVPVNGHTVYLQDGEGVLGQYIVNDGENLCKTESPIVYYTNDEYYEDDTTSYTLVYDNADSNEIEGKHVVIDSEIEPICEYAILKDGKLHLQEVEVEELEVEDSNQALIQQQQPEVRTIDLNKITGRNLVTGQTVTLDTYFQKLQEQLRSGESTALVVENRADGVADRNLINRKVPIGKTAGGKRIVGKILHFQSSDSTEKSSGSVVDEEETIQATIVRKKHKVLTKENCDESIGKTLIGLMDLESVRSKIQGKKLAVKVVDKIYSTKTNNFIKTISYVYGHMESVTDDNWNFEVHDSNDVESAEVIADDGSTKDETIVFVTIVTTLDGNGKKSIRVNLVPSMVQNKCHLCGKEFKSFQQMCRHVVSAHGTDSAQMCSTCGKRFASSAVLERHKRMMACHKLYECPKCKKSFNSAGSLKRHLTIHDPSLRPLECSVCSQRFTDESSLRKHLLIHTGIRAYTCNVCTRSFRNRGDLNFHRRIHNPVKQFSCEVCGRAFSRYSNMLRHTDIHRGTGTLHRCDICGCSYSFVSSLTRHIVQKHLNSE